MPECRFRNDQRTGFERAVGRALRRAVGGGDREGLFAEFEHNESRIAPDACRENARRFDAGRFRREFRDFVEARLSASRAAALR